jgi:hypothetical protein
MVDYNNDSSGQPQRLVFAVMLLLIFFALMHWQNSFFQIQPRQKVVLPDARLTDEPIDVFQADASWQKLLFDANDLLIIDEKTEPALVPLVDVWLGENPQELLFRIEYLLKKQYSDNAGDQIVSIVKKLSQYKPQERLWMVENTHVVPPSYQSLFALQDAYLGADLAEQLYGPQRAMMKAMLDGYSAKQLRQGSSSVLQPHQD